MDINDIQQPGVTPDPKNWLDDRVRNLNTLQKTFTDKYFPGGDAFDDPVVRVHDAAHQWANISPSPYGEAQQTIVDAAGIRDLTEKTGAFGFANQPYFNKNYAHVSTDDLERTLDSLRAYQESDLLQTGMPGVQARRAQNPNAYKNWDMRSDIAERPLTDQAHFNPSFTFEDLNNPSRTYKPGIKKDEFQELMRRGREFYGQVEKNLPENFPRIPTSSINSSFDRTNTFPNGQTLTTNPPANFIHDFGDNINVAGGYDKPGALPYGDIMQHVSFPQHIGYDVGAYRAKVAPLIEKYAQDVANKTELTSPNITDINYKFGGVTNDLASALSSAGGPADKIGSTSAFNDWKSQAGTDTVARLPNNAVVNSILADLRDIPRVKNALKLGNTIGGSLAGNLPLFDPELHKALETRNYGQAAVTTAKGVGTGLVGEGLTTVGAGVLQRVAPSVAAAVLPAAAEVASFAGPVGLMVGGGMAADAAIKGLTGRNTVQNVRHALGTDRSALDQLFPQARSVSANTPTGVARIVPTRPQPSPFESVARFAGQGLGSLGSKVVSSGANKLQQGYGWLDKTLFRGFLPGGAARN